MKRRGDGARIINAILEEAERQKNARYWERAARAWDIAKEREAKGERMTLEEFERIIYPDPLDCGKGSPHGNQEQSG